MSTKLPSGALIVPVWEQPCPKHPRYAKKRAPTSVVHRFGNLESPKREVHVSITTFVGTCPGARHYEAHLEEEDDAVWFPKPEEWASDYASRGFWKRVYGYDRPKREFRGRFVDDRRRGGRSGLDKARDFIRRHLKHFPPEKFKLEAGSFSLPVRVEGVYEHPDNISEPDHVYLRDGD